MTCIGITMLWDVVGNGVKSDIEVCLYTTRRKLTAASKVPTLKFLTSLELHYQ